MWIFDYVRQQIGEIGVVVCGGGVSSPTLHHFFLLPVTDSDSEEGSRCDVKTKSDIT